MLREELVFEMNLSILDAILKFVDISKMLTSAQTSSSYVGRPGLSLQICCCFVCS